jgi:phosphoglycerate kinase
VKAIAANADFYVNDAFSAAHRAHATTEGLAHVLPAYAGRSMQAELEALEKALGNPVKPVAAVVGARRCRPNWMCSSISSPRWIT